MQYAHSKLKFIAPNFNPIILKIFNCLLPIFLKFRLRPWLVAGIKKIEVINPQIIVKLYNDFQQKKIRLLIAFRHPEVDDPLCLTYLFSRVIPKTAQQQNIKLKNPIHTHFIYDRGMTIWAGNWLGWLFSKGGGIPIHRGKPLDRTALRMARELSINGQFPLAIAPEGANNGHSEIVSILEPGIAQIGLWCVQDLLKENRQEKVLILPINIQYRYINKPWKNLDKLLLQLEKDSGIKTQSIKDYSSKEIVIKLCYERLLILSDKLLTEMEHFYLRFYHCHIPQLNLKKIRSPENSKILKEEILIKRLEILLDMALTVGESYFNIEKKGNIIDRCRRLEEAGWNYIYREDIEDINKISPLETGLAHWIAQEAEIRIKNMRLVESFVAMTANYIKEKPSFERLAETTLILFDVMARIKGEKTPKRPRLGQRIAKLTIGNPLCVTEYFQLGQINQIKTKQIVKNLTNELQVIFENM
jgi:1-acyl-sn-glycerol-3-phosphate acyltransferase